MTNELDAVLEYDPLKVAKGEQNSVLAHAKILKAKKDQETSLIEQKLEEILGEIADYIGVQKKFEVSYDSDGQIYKYLIVVELSRGEGFRYNGIEVKLRIAYKNRYDKGKYTIDICYTKWGRSFGTQHETDTYWPWPLREKFFFQKRYEKKKLSVMNSIKAELVKIAAGAKE